MRIVCVGEILFDVIGENEYLGGAPLNFGAHAQKLGHEVFLLSGVGNDDRGRRALTQLKDRGISTEFVQVMSEQNTGTAEVELDMEGKPAFRIVRPAAYDFVDLPPAQLHRLGSLKPDWIYFGTLYHMSTQAMDSTERLLRTTSATKRFYDVNLREGNWHLSTIEQLSTNATVVKFSDCEAETLDASLNTETPDSSLENFCRRWRTRFQCGTICVTCGERGCAILKNGEFVQVPGYSVQVADTVGAGDSFAAAFLHGLNQGWDASRIGHFANGVGALVASRTGAIPDWRIDEVYKLTGLKPVPEHASAR